MTRGPKHHLKRLVAPRHWMLNKLGGIFAPRPSTGPHKLRECVPLVVVLRNRLKYALTRREVMMITMSRAIKVDHKVRTDWNFPCGFMDVISIDKANQVFRLLYDVKGRFVLHRITAEEGKYKLAKVKKLLLGSRQSQGHNPFETGVRSAVPLLVTSDGRTIRYPDPLIKTNDTVQIDLETGKISNFMKFDVGMMAMITAGHNIGRVGVIVSRERHPGSFDIVHLRDKAGHEFATRMGNVFVIGTETTPAVTLPKGNGIKLSVFEERAKRTQKAAGKA
jgi:small subunit ribosomal protein S4e